MDLSNRKTRKKILRLLLEQILSGNYSNQNFDPKKLNPLLDQMTIDNKKKYVSPLDRSTYNYGFMESFEMDGTSNPYVW